MPGCRRQGVRRAGQRASVNVRAIAQGASERNISVVVDGTQATRALRAVHASFYLSPHTLSIGVIGPGTVGRVLLDQLASAARAAGARVQARPARARHHALEAACCWPTRGVDAGALARGSCEAGTRAAGPGRASSSTCSVDHLPHAVIIDCTRQTQTVAQPLSRLAGGRHPRRHAEQEGQQRRAGVLRDVCKRRGATSGAHYLYEATVGAGLPVIQTLRDLRETGDEITQHRGHLLRHAGVSVQRLRRHARRSRPSCARPSSAATPSPIRAMTCPARTWRAS